MTDPFALLDELVEELLGDCNKHVNGYCLTSACLKRGGWKLGDVDTHRTIATCTRWEQANALKQLLAERKEKSITALLREALAACQTEQDLDELEEIVSELRIKKAAV